MASIPLIGGGEIRDYAHASKVFRSNGYARAGKHKFLYHVYFNINPVAQTFLSDKLDTREFSFMVKKAELPKFTMETQVMNQYNHKKIVQKKINYNPVNITFHDDNGNQIRELWRSYYNYYYADGRYDEGAYKIDDKYAPKLTRNAWGLSPFSKEPFFTSIDIYSLYANKSFKISLINPVIVSFNHDAHDYADNTGLMEHTMQVSYTTVKYLEGYWSGTAGFAEPNGYDTQPSSQTPDTAGQIYDNKTGQTVSPPAKFVDRSVPTNNQDAVKLAQLQAAQTNTQATNTLNDLDTSNIVNNQARNPGPYVFPSARYGSSSLDYNTGVSDVYRPISVVSEGSIIPDNSRYFGVYPQGSWQYALENRGYGNQDILLATTVVNAALLIGDISNTAQAILLATRFIANPEPYRTRYNISYTNTPSNYKTKLNNRSTQAVYNAQGWQQTLSNKGYKDFEIAQAEANLARVNLSPEVDRVAYAESYIKRLRMNNRVK